MRFYVTHAPGIDPCLQIGIFDQLLLCLGVRSSERIGASAMVLRTASKQTINMNPSRSAALSFFNTSIPTPSPRTYPLALLENVLQRPSSQSMPALLKLMCASGVMIV